MSSVTHDAFSEEPFRFGMLINDQRYRGYTIQIITLLLVMLAAAWLVNNVITNLEALGKEFTFSFLWQPSSYDIDQTLIDYTSRSPHWKAAVVGLLNTLLVAILGCIMATIIGVAAGVARLSNNWLVARLMTVYVEAFRNVPVLLWILIASAVFTEVLPTPKQTTPLLGDSLVFTNRGIYTLYPVFNEGSGIVAIVFLLSLVAAWLFRRWAHARQEATGEILPVFRIALAIIFLPAIAVFFILGSPIGMSYPELKGFNFQGGLRISGALCALWLGLSVYTGAFIAENVRAGIQAISSGQREAAAAVGLPPKRIMNLVILPQALRIIIPPLISQYLNLTKNSSLAIAVGYLDITGTLGGITLNQTGREMECLLLLMAIYLVISLTISAVMNVYNKSVALKER